MALPESPEELIRQYTLSEATQLKLAVPEWAVYGQREQTRREHLLELQAAFGFQPFGLPHYRAAVPWLAEVARQTDKGVVLVQALMGHLRRQGIVLPAIAVLERLSAEASTRANRWLYLTLTEDLTPETRQGLENLLTRREGSALTWLAWLRQAPAAPTSRQLLEHLARLAAWQQLGLPADLARRVHQNRLLKVAREGGQMTPADLAKFEPARRLATLVALALEGTATVLGELLDLHDRLVGKVFNAAKNKHQRQFQASGKAINQQVRLFGRIGQALLTARTTGTNPFAAIESVLPWAEFTASVGEAQQLAQPADFDFLHRVGEEPLVDAFYRQMRHASPAAEMLYLPAPASPKQPVYTIAYQKALYYFHRDEYYFHPVSGQLLKRIPHGRKSNGQKLIYVNYDLHRGQAFGLGGKLVAFLRSLLSASLPVTGLLAWWGKRNKPRRQRGREMGAAVGHTL